MARSRERRCIVSGEVLPESDLIRFVIDPDRHVVPDLDTKLPGRGAWVRADRQSLDKAIAKNLFSRAFETAVQVRADLVDQITARLNDKLLDQLGLARRAGRCILGYDAVRLALKDTTPPGLRIEASDGSDDGRSKLDRLAEAIAPGLVVMERFDADLMGERLGKGRVVHGLILAGPESDRIKALLLRLQHLEAGQD